MRKFKTVKFFIKFSKKWPKMAKNGQKLAEFWKFLFHRFSHPKNTPETGTSHFHVPCHSKDNFSSIILAKIRIFGQNWQKITKNLEKKWKIWTKWKIMRKFKAVKSFIKFSKKWPKWPKNGRILKYVISSFFSPQKSPETGTSHFHATLHSKDNFSLRISNFSNSNFGRSKKQTGEVKLFFFESFL